MNCSGKKILVVHAESLGALAVIRSLGNAGYTVYASSDKGTAIGFFSSFVYKNIISPPYKERKAYIQWLDETIAQYNVSCIVPSESMLDVIRNEYQKYVHLIPFPQSKKSIYENFSKYDFFYDLYFPSHKNSLSSGFAPTHFIDDDFDEKLFDENIVFPVFIKTDRKYAVNDDFHGDVIKVSSMDMLREKIEEEKKKYQKFIVQEFVAGELIGVSFFRWQGEVKLLSMMRAIHTLPHDGGISTYREMYQNEEIGSYVKNLLDALEYNGVGQFDFIYNANTNDFQLIEFNSRIWNYLNMELLAGFNYPKIWIDHFFGKIYDANLSEVSYIKARIAIPAELQHIWSKIKDNNIGFFEKIKSISQFFLLGLSPSVKSDYSYPGDKNLQYRALADWLSVVKDRLLP